MKTSVMERELAGDLGALPSTDRTIRTPGRFPPDHGSHPKSAITFAALARLFASTYGRYPGENIWVEQVKPREIGGESGRAFYRDLMNGNRDLPKATISLGLDIEYTSSDNWLRPPGNQYTPTRREEHLPGYVLEMARTEGTPFILFDISRLKHNYRLIGGALDGAEIFYPVKSNDQPRILSALYRWGSGFEAASWGEIEMLLGLGVEPGRIIFGTPIKPIEHIAAAFEAGVRLYACDSIAEITKLAQVAPGCGVYVRLAIPDRGDSVFPLSEKFGAQPRDVLEFLLTAREVRLKPCGISFHVGSQCLDPSSWWIAIASAAHVWNEARKAGLNLAILNMGGGIPVRYCQPVPAKEVFLSNISLALKSHFQRPPRLIMEPGRAMVGDIAVMVTTVIGKARREGKEWLYIDAGIYQGLVEAAQERDRFNYEVYAEGPGPLREYDIGGPTCDSGDVVTRGAVLPEVSCGDRVYILNTGAYTNVCATSFNGFPPPKTYFAGDEGGEDNSW